jgi:hypothetical protein
MAMFSVTIRIDGNRRIKVYPEGGFDLEAFVDGPGWVLDTDADVPDSVIEVYLDRAGVAIQNAMAKLRPCCEHVCDDECRSFGCKARQCDVAEDVRQPGRCIDCGSFNTSDGICRDCRAKGGA